MQHVHLTELTVAHAKHAATSKIILSKPQDINQRSATRKKQHAAPQDTPEILTAAYVTRSSPPVKRSPKHPIPG